MLSSNTCRRPAVLQISVALAASAALALLSSCAHPGTSASGMSAAPASSPTNETAALSSLLSISEATKYAGDAACKDCHAAIFLSYEKTHHEDTFRAVRTGREGAMFRKGGNLMDSRRHIRYTPSVENGACILSGADGVNQGELPASYVIGSADNGYTFFSHGSPDKWTELRLSFYPHEGKWSFTPNQAPSNEISSPAGIEFATPVMAACLRCHTTYLVGDNTHIDLSASHLGIGCEACHGPARAHVTAETAQPASESGTTMEQLSAAPASRIESLCGECHKEVGKSAGEKRNLEEQLARLQAVALERSACYLKSAAMSCTTCHDPHGNVSRDENRYRNICLSCHGGPPVHPRGRPRPPLRESTRPCPVQPAGNCIPCHMPRQSIGIRSVTSTNHWIKAWPGLTGRARLHASANNPA